jgi:putative ABC transport system permease protein
VKLRGLTALDRKLLRDLWGMHTQAIAIAAVIAAGIAMLVAYLSNFDSLTAARDAFYREQRFADLFAGVGRAPEQIASRLAAIDGVEDLTTRVVSDVVVDLPDVEGPASGRIVSIPGTGRPRLNDVFLRQGTWIEPGRADQVLVNEAFAEANGFGPGDSVAAVINGTRRELVITGIVLSPEFVYSLRPGDVVPDDRRNGIFWMARDALGSALDMDGAFNDVVVSLGRGAMPDAVAAAIDRVLAPYGGTGTTPRALQLSNFMLANELGQLQSFGFFVPLIFLLVAAFVLNIALTRALALQRTQLAALKALGYTDREIAWHYLKWALVIALAGAGLGVAAGIWMGGAMLDLYRDYFRFPALRFELTGGVVLASLGTAATAAMVGAWTAVRRAVSITPAEAMRPGAPVRYTPSLIETVLPPGWLGTTTRMVVRNLQRHPTRAVTTIIGIAMAGAILQVGFGLMQSVDALITREFNVVDRSDMSVTFVEPLGRAARHALAQLPGVLRVEPQRSVAARLRARHVERTLAITSLADESELRRPLDARLRPIVPRGEGLVVSAILADVLGVSPGDLVAVEILEGRRPVRDIVVEATVDDVLGTSAYMRAAALARLLQEDMTLSGAVLLIDSAREAELTTALGKAPAIAGLSSKRAALANFRQMMQENMGVMLTFNVLFAGVIAFGVVYNAARVSLSERSRELASLRVLGFTRAEISLILIGELAVLTALSLPFGAWFGHVLTSWLVTSVQSEMYRFPLVFDIRATALAALTVVVASLVSGLLVRRRLDTLDLVGVLKLRE